MTEPNIIEKAKKLLALRDRAGTQGEAEAAAFALAALLEKHRLSMAELEEDGKESVDGGFVDDEVALDSSGRLSSWRRQLMNSLSKHYGVALWWRSSWVDGRRVKKTYMCGKPDDIAIMHFMYNWLCVEILRVSQQNCEGYGRKYNNSYKLGFVSGIHTQLRKAREQETKEVKESIALVLRDRKDLATDALNKLRPGLKVSKRQKKCFIDPFAFSSGRQRGKIHHLGKSLPK